MLAPPHRSSRWKRASVLVLALAAPFALQPTEARAEPRKNEPSPDADVEVTRRLAFIAERFERRTPAAQRWWYGWYGGWTALTAIQAGVALGVHDRGLRIDAAVGAAFSSLGVVPFALFPFQPLHAAADLRALPEGTPEARRRKLARAERLLEQSAKTEALGRSWLPQTMGVLASLASGLTLVLAYKRPIFSGLVQAVGGTVLCEVQVFTQPTGAIDDWKEYREHGGAASKPISMHRATPSLRLLPSPTGLQMTGTF